MNEYLDSLSKVLPVAAFALLAVGTVLFLAKTYVKHNLVILFFNSLVMRVFANILGMALVCVSAFLNVGFVVGVGRGYPDAAGMIPILATLAGAVNLAAPLAVLVAWTAYRKKQTSLAIVAGTGYLLILFFSLTTGSTVIHSSAGNISTQRDNADLVTRTNQELIRANKAQMQDALTYANPEALALGGTTMTNANGARVSVSKYCSHGNWYFNNRPVCRDYLAAQQSTEALAGVATLRTENKQLLKAGLDAQLNKPTPMLPKFLGFDLPENIMFSLCILVLEIAALVCFLYGRTTAPSDTVEITVSDLQSAADLSQTVRQSKGSQSKSKRSQTGRSDNSANLKHVAEAPPLKEQKRAYMDSIGEVQPEGSIPTELLEDLLYQLATYNPKAQLNADHVIKIIANNRDGVSVGKQRLLNIIASDRMSDIVLTSTTNGRKVYSFKQVAGASNVQQPASVQGLPTSQSALSQGGAADHGRRTG